MMDLTSDEIGIGVEAIDIQDPQRPVGHRCRYTLEGWAKVVRGDLAKIFCSPAAIPQEAS